MRNVSIRAIRPLVGALLDEIGDFELRDLVLKAAIRTRGIHLDAAALHKLEAI